MQKATFKDALKFWTKLGFISFGGPAGQIAIMHQEVVERRKWIGENQFLRALNFCMLLPGPEAQQLATYMGWRLHGIWGGIAAGSLFIIPSIFIMLLLSYLAVAHIDVPVVAAAFYGIQPVVVAVVIEAVLRIGKKALKHPVLYAFAAAAFVAIFFLKIPFPYIVTLAALGGLLAVLGTILAADPGGKDDPLATVSYIAKHAQFVREEAEAGRSLRLGPGTELVIVEPAYTDLAVREFDPLRDTLIDLTAGTPVQLSSLAAGHHYVNASNHDVFVELDTETVLLLRGEWK